MKCLLQTLTSEKKVPNHLDLNLIDKLGRVLSNGSVQVSEECFMNTSLFGKGNIIQIDSNAKSQNKIIIIIYFKTTSTTIPTK